ncbi:MAG: VCBS repeat-containing protein [Kiritimatiellota bacterium]|nr:VCBS repeat-containing protein [Kiritimatiellota bacterium]
MKACIHSLNWLVPLRLALALMAALALPWLVLAQTNAPSAGTATNQPVTGTSGNMISAGFGGEATTNLGNYWDGVDADNDLHVNVANSLVLNDAGQMVDTPMSSYPNFVDMNDDGLNDLVVSDTQGFLWIYLNSGEKGKPRFTTGTFIHTFLGWGAKIHVCDWDGDGDQDVVFGTFYGDIGILPNTGTRKQWQFTRRMGVPRYVDPQFGLDDPQDRLPTLMLGKQPMILGNYMSPWVTDWNKDGKPDLILGEGTYSANSVRLLLNAGSRNKPVFVEERMFYLSYGEGFEQLTPAVVDYNGDGLPDLIVGTRTGQIRLHKGTLKAIEGKDMVAAIRGVLAPAVLEFDGFLKIADKEVFDTMSFVYPCDWNEDGLFDLLLGSPKGKVYIALNQGSKTEPKFPKAEPVKGTDTAKDMPAPANWFGGIGRVFWSNYLGGYCNSALLFSVEKELILKAGSQPILPVEGNTFMYFRYVNNYPGFTRNYQTSWIRPISSSPTAEHVVGGRFISPFCTFELKIKRQYELSFSSIVEGKPAMWTFWAHEMIRSGTEDTAPMWEPRYAFDMIPPSGAWQKRAYRFKCPSTVQSNLNYYLYFRMPEGEVKFLLDNLSLKEVER